MKTQNNTLPLLYIIPILIASILAIKLIKDFNKELDTTQYRNIKMKTKEFGSKYRTPTLKLSSPAKFKPAVFKPRDAEFTKQKAVHLIRKISYRMNVDPLLVQAIVEYESQYNTHAKNPKSTARGLMQVLKGTAKFHCGLHDNTLLHNPEIGLSCGIQVFKDRLKKTGSAFKALGAYYCGLGGLRKDPKKCDAYAKDIQKIYVTL